MRVFNLESEHSEIRWFCGVPALLIVVPGVAAALAGMRRTRDAGR
jgi:hypothetical protein